MRLGTGNAKDDDPADGTGRQVRAEVLVALMCGAIEIEPGQVGQVRLQGACITGKIDFPGARFKHRLELKRCCIADGIDLSDATTLTLDLTGCYVGPICLRRAKIKGRLVLSGTQLDGKGGLALTADDLTVARDMHCQDLRAGGGIRLIRASIGGQLSFSNAQLDGKGGLALTANGLTVTEDMACDGFSPSGEIRLIRASIGGQLSFSGAHLKAHDKNSDALNAEGVQIRGTLDWAPAEVTGHVSLKDAAVGELEDDWTPPVSGPANGHWPLDGQLSLDGFTYTRIGRDDQARDQANVKQRLEWIRSQYKSAAKDSPAIFSTQPYEQLANVYRQAGQDTEARKIEIAKRADLRRRGNLNPYRKFANWLLDKTISYGYQAWRAGIGLVVLFAIFVVLSFGAQYHNLIVPAQNTSGLPSVPTAAHCTTDYPCFHPVGYAIDTVMPIINLHQAEYWRPGGWFVYVTWAGIVLGWALVTLLVAGYTVLIRQD